MSIRLSMKRGLLLPFRNHPDKQHWLTADLLRLTQLIAFNPQRAASELRPWAIVPVGQP